MEFSDHFFRRESGRIVSALIKIFGVHNLDLAEDVTQDAFCRALEVWKMRGIPQNPSAWLMATAKNRAIDALRRERTARKFSPEYGQLLESEWTLAPLLDDQLGPNAIKDDQLRVMFSCCGHGLSEDAQGALILHILCGFSVGEIASAYLSSRSAVEKRLTRSKKVLARSEILFNLSDASELTARLPSVQRALYLLFNEGYHGASPENPIRAELCEEAIRLGKMLLEHTMGAVPGSFALCALMLLHAARLPGRLDAYGDLAPLSKQNRALWNTDLARQGAEFLERSVGGGPITTYHLEAMIAFEHTKAPSAAETNWPAIVMLYEGLLRLHPSPIIELNRAIALAEAEGPESGLAAIRAIENIDRLGSYPFYHAALGELAQRQGHSKEAAEHFMAAKDLARNPQERRFLGKRLEECRARK